MAVNNLYQPWRAILSMINQCLTGKTSRFDRPRYLVLQMLWGIITRTNVDYAELMWEEFVQAIRLSRLTKDNLGIATKKDKRLIPIVILDWFGFTTLISAIWGENTTSTKGLGLRLTWQKLITILEISSSSPKAKKMKQSKPVLYPAKQPKPVKEKSTKPSPVKKAGKGEEVYYDLQQGIQISLESFQPPVDGVAFREPASSITHKLPIVEDAETGADTDKTNNEGDTEILNIGEEQGEDVANKVDLEEKPAEIDEGPGGSGPVNTPESQPRERYFSWKRRPGLDQTLDKVMWLLLDQTLSPCMMTSLPLYPALASRVSDLETVCANFEKRYKLQDKTVQGFSSRVFTLELRDLPHKIDQTVNEVVKEMFDSGSYKSHPEHEALYEALEVSMDRDNQEELHETLTTSPSQSEQPIDDVPILDDVHISNSEDISAAPLLKIKTRPDWLKPIPEEDRPETPEPDWIIPSNDLPKPENNWANAFATSKSKLSKADLEGPTYKVVRAFHSNSISYQFQMEECHMLLTDQIDLVNLDGHRVIPDVSKSLPLGSRRTKEVLCLYQAVRQLNYPGLWARRTVPSRWMKVEREFTSQDNIQIRYTYLTKRLFYAELTTMNTRSQNLHPNDFKDMYLLHLQGKLNHLSGSNKVNLFNAVNMWIRNPLLSEKLCERLCNTGIESYQTKLNLTEPNWDAFDFLYKEDYTIVSKPRAVIYRDRNDQKKMMRENEVHKFSDSTLTRILERLDHMVKDFRLFNVEPKQIILDPHDQPMWESAKTVAPTPNSAIVQLDVDDNFVINNSHLIMIRENKFEGYLRADPHDHIHEFLAICNMFRYGETQSESIKLLIFPFSLCNEAKTWFNELNKESITLWKQMRKTFINRFFPPSLFNRLLHEIRNFSQLVCESLTDAWLQLKSMLRKCHGHGLTKGAIIQIFYHGLDEPTQAILDVTAGGIFLYKSPNQAFQLLEDKVLFNHDWPIKSNNEHHQKSVAFDDGSNSNNDKF
ncbi:reverse transcriptase domain-containing protein [Tanacetum coccineum]|uniref:Reverse transcriptase domain-containing protein n=1 Tax=Tanacetum coccineum TaxID=301880 RepID=A0ABQ5ERR5_9ASTR